MMTKDFGMRFFGRMPFSAGARKEFFDKWQKMTDEEKLAWMNERMDAVKNHEFGHRNFSVAHIDQHCEEWMKKTSEEKEALIKGWKEMMAKFHEHAEHFHRRGFGFDFGEEQEAK